MAGSPNSNLRGFNHAVQTLLKQPTQFLPHLTIPTFTHLPENPGPYLINAKKGLQPEKPPQTPTIRALTNPHSILIVSNRAGSHANFDGEVSELEAQLAHLRIPVFRLPAGAEKKPFCGDEVVQWFRERGVVESAHEIAVVGDRLGTDVLMAGMMGSWSVWCKEGVFDVGMKGKPERNILEKMEVWIEWFLREKRGCVAPLPMGWEKQKKL
ncbi:HAD-superfamily phosphatase subfamily IIIA [Penicillium cf. griseofulvum]|nr:HAD-superfamily phosphatase subfamily IIIA [Penicillium cf. griseofulvum]